MKIMRLFYAVALVLVILPAFTYSFLMRSSLVGHSMTAQILSVLVFLAGLVLLFATERSEELKK